MIAEFLHYYPAYTLEAVLAMYSISFYALLTAMYRLKGVDSYDRAILTASANAGGGALESYLKSAKKQAGGAHQLLEEVRVAKGVKNGK